MMSQVFPGYTEFLHQANQEFGYTPHVDYELADAEGSASLRKLSDVATLIPNASRYTEDQKAAILEQASRHVRALRVTIRAAEAIEVFIRDAFGATGKPKAKPAPEPTIEPEPEPKPGKGK